MQQTQPPANQVHPPLTLSFGRFRLPLEIVFVALLGTLALTVNIGQRPLVDWDEATYAQVAHEALARHQILDLSWNGAPYVKKPPLLFWMVTVSFRLLGESELSARLPSVIVGIGTLILIYLFAAPVLGRLGGLLAGIVPLGFYFFIARGGRECATDAPLIFFSTLAIYALARGPQKRLWLSLSGVACGLAILSKGLAGVLPLIVAAGAFWFIPGFSGAGLGGMIWIITGAAAVAGPWCIYEALFNYPVFLANFVGYETLRRVTTHLEDDQLGADFALVTFGSEIEHLWPLILPLAAYTVGALRNGLMASLRRVPSAVWLWLWWLAVTLAASCAVQTRLPWYVLPALVPTALLAAAVPAYALRGPNIRTASVVLAVAALVLIALHAPKRWHTINQTAQRQRALSMPSYVLGIKARNANGADPGGELFFAGVSLPTLVYYSAMRCNFVETSELAHVELVGAAAVPDAIHWHDLVLLDPNGKADVIGNLDHEWHWSTDTPAN
ncbi:MAG TPA: glycosyltransferase family 39 protein [Candidatus Binataceae bacterium]|jgi:4-amino-4-deoxy-L-arabinose transferase-like glycosyltransferase|nr:glycosyltransferase family 39 protein [Candidatus Binataceae bacterium]